MKQNILNTLLIIILVISTLVLSCEPSNTESGIEDDEYEPDDSISEATEIELDKVYPHTISSYGDIDYVKIYLEKGSNYRFNLSKIYGFEPEVSLYDSDGATLIEMKNTNNYSDLYDWWGYDSDHNYLEEEKQSIVHKTTHSGYFYFSVKDIYDAHMKGSYELFVHKVFTIDTPILEVQENIENLSIDLSWDSISGVDGYRVYRTSIQQDTADPEYDDFIQISPTSNNYYTDTTISLNTTYYYYIRGYIYNMLGEPSNIDSGIISLSVGEASDLTVTADYASHSIKLEWGSIDHAQTYNIYRTDTTQDTQNPVYDDFVLIDTIEANQYFDTNINSDIRYYYYITAVTLNEEGSPSNCDDALYSLGETNTLSAVPNIAQLSIDITWDNISGADGYKLYRTDITQDLGNPVYAEFSLISELENNDYSDTDVLTDTTYYYYVTGTFNNTESSSPSNVDDAVISIPTVSDLIAEPNASSLSIDVTWGSIADVDGYKLYRTDVYQSDISNPNYSDFSLIATLGDSSSVSYADTDVELNINYYYYIEAYIDDEHSEPGNCDDAEIVVNVGNTDTLTAEPNASALSIDVSWGSIADVDGYKLYRTDVYQSDISNPNYSDFSLIATLSQTTYEDNNIELNTNYYYYVKGYFSTVNGLPSNCDDAEVIIGGADLVSTANTANLTIDVSWDTIVGVDGYNLYRTTTPQDIASPNYGDFTLLTSLSGNGSVSYSDSSADIDIRYYYYVIGYIGESTNEQGSESNVDFAKITIGNTQDLIATTSALSEMSINLDWSIITGVNGYNIYRTDITQDLGNPDYSDFTLLDSISGGSNTNYTDNSIEPNVKYYYYVIGTVDSVEEGTESNIDDAKLIFSAPQNFTATADVSNFEIELSWDDMSGVDGYKVYRTDITQDINNPDYGDFSEISTVQDSNYTDSNIVNGVKYYYYVRAYIGDKDSLGSDIDDAVVEIPSPANLVASSNLNDFHIDVSWDSVSSADEYKLYRTDITQDINNPDYGDFSLIATLVDITYDDIDIQPNISYYYYVKAVSNGYEGSPGNCDDALFDWESFKPKSGLISASDGLYANKIVITFLDKYDYNSNIKRYEVYRADELGEIPTTYVGTFSASTPLGSTIDDLNVVAGHYYWYSVRIVIELGGVEYSSDYSWFDSGVASG